MNKEYIWQSNLGPYIKDFIALKKSNGFSYETEKYYLIQFDKLCMSNDEFNKEGISKELSDKWSIQSQTEGKTYRSKRVCATRQLGLYLLSIGKEAYIPHFKGSLDKTITYIPTFKELQSLFKYIDKYIPGNNNRISLQLAIIYPIIFRLMFCCGLRLSETTKIKCDLIDLNKGTLTILKSKGLKERMIPIAQDVCELCKIYNKKISKLVPQRIYFFPGKDKDVAIANPTVQKKFHKFWLQAFPYWNNKFPTCHSLRHLFVIHRIELWISEGENVENLMPYISKYLGHKSIENTYYYYHNLESIAPILRKKDVLFVKMIPEVMKYEK